MRLISRAALVVHFLHSPPTPQYQRTLPARDCRVSAKRAVFDISATGRRGVGGGGGEGEGEGRKRGRICIELVFTEPCEFESSWSALWLTSIFKKISFVTIKHSVKSSRRRKNLNKLKFFTSGGRSKLCGIGSSSQSSVNTTFMQILSHFLPPPLPGPTPCSQ